MGDSLIAPRDIFSIGNSTNIIDEDGIDFRTEVISAKVNMWYHPYGQHRDKGPTGV